MKIKIGFIFVILLALGGSAFAQGYRVDSQISQELLTTQITNATNVLTIPSGAAVSFCTFPANAVPCTNKATTYSSVTLSTPCSTSTQIVLTGTTSCVASPDAQGNWGVWVPAGQYSYTITIAGVNYGPYVVNFGVPSGTNLSLGSLTTTGPNNLAGGGAFSGNYTHSGTEIFNGPIALPNTTSSSVGAIDFGGTQFIHNFGVSNTFVGSGVGNFSLSGVSNSGFGFNVLQSLTSGNSDTAFGSDALLATTSGGGNAAFGDGSLAANTSGQSNAAFGHFALTANTTGQGSSAFGTLALSSLVGGTNTNNSAFGIAALQHVTSGTNNNGFGADALLNLTTGSNNMAFGVSPGAGPGAAYTSSESNNIDIGNIGVVGESGAIHLGTPGTQTVTYLISPLAVGNAAALTGTGACLTANLTAQAGSWAGTVTCGNTTGASTLILTATAPHGWFCQAQDNTTAANVLRQSAGAALTTGCTISGTVNANDVLTFLFFPY